jgi:hypothetical protein
MNATAGSKARAALRHSSARFGREILFVKSPQVIAVQRMAYADIWKSVGKEGIKNLEENGAKDQRYGSSSRTIW